ncbi:MAG: antitoxin [Gammaproteobacteria bacterium]|nr:antitoxin [Gammaproteobacteria bacterium]
MVITTRVFASGNSQAIRLPKEFRLATRRVNIRRSGHALIVEPLPDDFGRLAAVLDEFTEDFMSERAEPETQEREGL